MVERFVMHLTWRGEATHRELIPKCVSRNCTKIIDCAISGCTHEFCRKNIFDQMCGMRCRQIWLKGE